MKIINPIISFFSSLLFLKEYNFNEEKTRRIKNRFPYLLAIWALLVLPFKFPLTNIFENIPENVGIQLEFLFFLLFAIYHWFILVYISKFARKHIAYLILLLPMIYYFKQNLIVWNEPTYYGAMDGFAAIATIEKQLLIVVTFPTFLFALRMVKIENYFKGILLLLIILYSGIMGVEQCIGKEGYLSDGNGEIFVFFIVLLLVVAFLLLKPINFKKV